MFIIYSLIIGIIIGYCAGGSIKNLACQRFRHIWIVMFAFILQFLLFSDFILLQINSFVVVLLHLISYVALLTFVFINRKVWGVLVIGTGIFLNSLVIFLNGGYMPTYSEYLASTSMSKHAEAISRGETVHNSIGITEETLLPWLGDIFHLPSWIPFSNVFSIGDVIIGVGVCIYFAYAMRPVKTISTAQ